MAQERTGIVVGTNSGHVRYPPPFWQCRILDLCSLSVGNFSVQSSRGFMVKTSPQALYELEEQSVWKYDRK